MDINLFVKKALTLFLLSIFLLNVLGFYGVFLGMESMNEARNIEALNKNIYHASDEITFAVPLAVPYYTNDESDFTRVDGDFEHDGEVYRMVKQKLHRDTLFVVCIKDEQGKQIHQAMSDFVKTFAGKPLSAKNNASKSLTSFSKDYFSIVINIEQSDAGWNETVSFHELNCQLNSQPLAEIEFPPRPAGC